ncbi:hypothetical protein Tc00.1047053507063.280 [Trypanosoma cruzi]|uniref:Uncharacterized protein n=1 Tax=Trypanosoma cruzi (strain CL Brener) TaxID=353153 RepID=Q4E010_TRYCC|nr:hypothetical protein Tc00.1047053507063.280 [Trypanosoma cruzi]EAN98129.1 hypothetical protein Tc00.1047053507063.280 [Trypanosoma cruzi]|eukprot:XP_819980.1 hypothetical protein [Trypanosoma cruzi strain CL Brener]
MMDGISPKSAQCGLDAASSPLPGEERIFLMQSPQRSATAASYHLYHGRDNAAEAAPYLVATQSHAYMNLPPAIDVETVEEAKAMLEHWEAWNFHIQQQLQLNSKPSSMNKMGDHAPALAADYLYSPAYHLTGTNAETIVGNSLCKNMAAEHSHLHNELKVELGPAARVMKASKHPFSVATRTTVATAQRMVRPESTRRSRALLIKRALELVGKPLGRAGSDGNNGVDKFEQPSAVKQASKDRAEVESQVKVEDSLTEAGTLVDSNLEEMKIRSDPLAIVWRLQRRLREETWRSATDSLAHLEASNGGSKKDNDKLLAWPEPPSRLHRELSHYEELGKFISLAPLDSLSVTARGKMQGEDNHSMWLSQIHAIPNGAVIIRGEEYAQQPEENKETVNDESSSDDSPPRGFPTVLLRQSAVAILPTLQTAVGDLDSESGDSVAEVTHEFLEATRSRDDMYGELEEVVCKAEHSGPSVRMATQSEEFGEVKSMTVEDEKECTTTLTDAAFVAKGEESEEDALETSGNDEREGIMLLANDKGQHISEKGAASQSECKNSSMVSEDVQNGYITNFDDICAMRELKAEEYTNRISLVMEESLQLSELCILSRSVTMNFAKRSCADFGPNSVKEEKSVSASIIGTEDVLGNGNEMASKMMPQRWIERILFSPHVSQSRPQRWRSKRRRGKVRSRCLTGLQKNSGDIEKKLQAETLKTCLNEALSAVQDARVEISTEAQRFSKEKAEMEESLMELQENLAAKDQTINTLHSSIRDLHLVIDQLKRRLDENARESAAIEKLIQVTVAELRVANDALESAAEKHENALRTQAELFGARLCETMIVLQEAHKKSEEELHCEKDKFLALERAANVRLTELQSNLLESTATEQRALRLAAALERALLLAKSSVEKHIAEKKLISLELFDVEERLWSARGQTAAAVAVIGRYVLISLIQRCFSRWMRKCRESRCRTLERVQRENNERRRELILWCDHVCFPNIAAVPVRRTRQPVISSNVSFEKAPVSLTAVAGVRAKRIGSAPAFAMEASEPRISGEALPCFCDVTKQMAHERLRAAALLAERDALRDALRESSAANSELLHQLEVALRGRTAPQ